MTLKKEYAAAFKSAERFDPIMDRILIKREKSALERRVEKSKLITPDNVKENYKSSEGVLIKCAPDCDDRVKALTGKRILFGRYMGDDIKVGDEEFVLCTDTDVFGELKEAQA